VLFLTIFTGCGAEKDSSIPGEMMEILSNAVERLSRANSIEYLYTNMSDIVLEDATRSHSFSESAIKMVRTPYTILGRMTSVNDRSGENSESSFRETYYEIKNGILYMYVRPPFDMLNLEPEKIMVGEWQLFLEADEHLTAIVVDNAFAPLEAGLYLIKSNMNNFVSCETIKIGSEDFYIYEGFIDIETVLNAYRIYLRDYFLEVPTTPMPLPETFDPTDEQLRAEITSGKHYDLLQWIPSLAFAENRTPITIWIDAEELTIKKVEVDKKEAVQAMADMVSEQERSLFSPDVDYAVTIYEILGIDAFSTIEMPE